MISRKVVQMIVVVDDRYRSLHFEVFLQLNFVQVLDDIGSLDLDQYDQGELKANGHEQLNANQNNHKKQEITDEELINPHST